MARGVWGGARLPSRERARERAADGKKVVLGDGSNGTTCKVCLGQRPAGCPLCYKRPSRPGSRIDEKSVKHTLLVNEHAIELSRKTVQYVTVYVRALVGSEVAKFRVDQLTPMWYLFFLYRCNSGVAGCAPRVNLWLPTQAGVAITTDELRAPTALDGGEPMGEFSLADYGVRGAQVVLFQTVTANHRAVSDVVRSYYALNFRWADGADVSCEVLRDLKQIRTGLPESDEVQRRLVGVMERQLEWREGVDAADEAEDEAKKVQEVQVRVEKRRVARILRARQERERRG